MMTVFMLVAENSHFLLLPACLPVSLLAAALLLQLLCI
jgi:hypothetical protein